MKLVVTHWSGLQWFYLGYQFTKHVRRLNPVGKSHSGSVLGQLDTGVMKLRLWNCASQNSHPMLTTKAFLPSDKHFGFKYRSG